MRKVLIAVAVLLVAFVGFVATRPSIFSVERSLVINAPAEVAFAQVADFGHWAAWSPWNKLDPQMKTTLAGTPAAVGHSYAWIGNDKVGEGRMTLTEVAAPRELHIELAFIQPFASTNETVFTFTPVEGGTRVKWAMHGNNDFLGKAFSIFFNMDKAVGGDFEKGLADLETASQAELKKMAFERKAAEDAAAAAAAAAPAPEGVTVPASAK